MNKEQAEHILDGYLLIHGNPKMDGAANALREIIIDAMTGYKTVGYASTYPYTITVPSSNYPINTSVTCKGGEQ